MSKWWEQHQRGIKMKDEADKLMHEALYEMRCTEITDKKNIPRRCMLDKDHEGPCQPVIQS